MQVAGFKLEGFDGDAIKKAMKKQVDAAMRDRQQSLQQVVDGLARSHKGRPVDEIKPVLAKRWRDALDGSGSISEPQLSEWAQYLSDGRKIQFKYDGTNW